MKIKKVSHFFDDSPFHIGVGWYFYLLQAKCKLTCCKQNTNRR